MSKEEEIYKYSNPDKVIKIANKKFGWETRCAGCGKMVNVKILYCPNCGLKD